MAQARVSEPPAGGDALTAETPELPQLAEAVDGPSQAIELIPATTGCGRELAAAENLIALGVFAPAVWVAGKMFPPLARGDTGLLPMVFPVVVMLLASLLMSLGEMGSGTIAERLVGVRRLRADFRPLRFRDWLLRHWPSAVPFAYMVAALFLARWERSFDTTRQFGEWMTWNLKLLAVPTVLLMVCGLLLRGRLAPIIVVEWPKRQRRTLQPRGFQVVQRRKI